MAVPPEILENARALRAKLTDGEQLLWYLLRDRRFCGIKFRRQHSIGRHIVDFYCHAARLAVELDGGGHAEPKQQAYDEERTRSLANAGVKVLRFWNHEVLNNLEVVLSRLHAELFPSPGLRPPSRSLTLFAYLPFRGRGQLNDLPSPYPNGLSRRW